MQGYIAIFSNAPQDILICDVIYGLMRVVKNIYEFLENEHNYLVEPRTL